MLNRKTRKRISRAMRIYIERQSYGDWIAKRAELRALLDRVQVCGQVGVITHGMDCDCCECHREDVRPAFRSVIEASRFLDISYSDAEGPHTVSFVQPGKIDRGRNGSRDRALEAFEDGHAHSVSMGDWS